jgi:hypothetical protein
MWSWAKHRPAFGRAVLAAESCTPIPVCTKRQDRVSRPAYGGPVLNWNWRFIVVRRRFLHSCRRTTSQRVRRPGRAALAAEELRIQELLPKFSRTGGHLEPVGASPWENLSTADSRRLYGAALRRLPAMHAALLAAASVADRSGLAVREWLDNPGTRRSLHRARMALLTLAAAILNESQSRSRGRAARLLIPTRSRRRPLAPAGARRLRFLESRRSHPPT